MYRGGTILRSPVSPGGDRPKPQRATDGNSRDAEATRIRGGYVRRARSRNGGALGISI